MATEEECGSFHHLEKGRSLAAESPDIALIDRTITMHKYPLGVFIETGTSERAQDLVAFVVILCTVEPTLGIVKHAQHELILLDEFLLGSALRIPLADTVGQQH